VAFTEAEFLAAAPTLRGVAAPGVATALVRGVGGWLPRVPVVITATGAAASTGRYTGTTTWGRGITPGWGYDGPGGAAAAEALTAGLVRCLEGARVSGEVGVGLGVGTHAPGVITGELVAALAVELAAAHRATGVPGGRGGQYLEWARAVALVVGAGVGTGVVSGGASGGVTTVVAGGAFEP
jgi:hypothetical protein